MAAASASNAYPFLQQRSSWSLEPLAPPSVVERGPQEQLLPLPPSSALELGPLNHPAIQLLLLLLRSDEKRHARQQKEQKGKKHDGLPVT